MKEKEEKRHAHPIANNSAKSFQKDFFILLKRSEERIDKTNEMVCKLVETSNNMIAMLDKITAEYMRQLDKLQASRDEILAQNKMLINLVANNFSQGTTNVNISKNEKP